MNIKLQSLLFTAGAIVGAVGFADNAEEAVLLGGLLLLLAGVASWLDRRRERTKLAPAPELERRLSDVESRLALAEGELDAATRELDRIRAERDFDRQLAGPPAPMFGRPQP